MWLDNVYMRMAYIKEKAEKPLPRAQQTQSASLTGLNPLPLGLGDDERGLGQYYVTRSTFQGDGVGAAAGVWADERTYVESAWPPRLAIH